jgi:hypothetical protein
VENIRVRRIGDQVFVEPDSKRWQLVNDAKGYPHLYLQVLVEDDDGQMVKGYFCLDHMLDVTIKELMEEGNFGGKLSPEEEQEALAEFLADPNRPPCPHYDSSKMRS